MVCFEVIRQIFEHASSEVKGYVLYTKELKQIAWPMLTLKIPYS